MRLSLVSIARLARRGACPTAPDPLVNLARLELPQAADLVRWHPLFRYPCVHGVLGDAEVRRDASS